MGSAAPILRLEAKFGGVEPSAANRLKALEDENARVKRPLAGSRLDNAVLKDLPSKKW